MTIQVFIPTSGVNISARIAYGTNTFCECSACDGYNVPAKTVRYFQMGIFPMYMEVACHFVDDAWQPLVVSAYSDADYTHVTMQCDDLERVPDEAMMSIAGFVEGKNDYRWMV